MEKRTRRLGHKKSRNGCQRCKARRVKCDENRPCHRCVAHAAHCSLLDPPSGAPLTPPATAKPQQYLPIHASTAPARTASDASLTPTAGPQLTDAAGTSPYSADSAIDPRSAPPPPQPAAPDHDPGPDPDLSEEWLESLRLMHHYSTITCNVLPQDPCTEELWKTAIPELACSHKFLMHGLLALSALHYAHVHPEERRRWDIISVHHQNLALRFFATRLGDIDKSNCEAYFFLATLIFIASIYSVSHARPLARPVPVGLADVAQSFRFLHGVKGILDFQPLDEWRQRGGPLDVLLRSPRLRPGALDPDSPFQRRLDAVTALARRVPAAFDELINEQSVCVLALESLRRCHQMVRSEDDEQHQPGAVWGWSVTLPALFVDMIGAAHPAALVILAHYAALGRPCERGDWACRGWNRSVMLMVDDAIDDEWRHWIRWPMKSIMEEIDVDDMNDSD
ncbi:C6 zinc finger domain-containing protein [Colletotrichum musicola]|uniref:C6 zinc finger domain-containing protein n=1 Tax=Colletotrichum musicola TaxID=2175873 RepID=A0A8H6JEE2_9PEZI|nr:C6 zinc finger domain-containing protein [Colletotrichum musicola]